MLLDAVSEFAQVASACPGVRRIALVGSLTTDKPIPKDADLLITIDSGMDLAALARAGRRLKGQAQSINLGADIFLADEAGRYLGRICGYRECHSRALCHARHCGERQHLNDDLDDVTLAASLIAAPPLELWPAVIRRLAVPPDVEAILPTNAASPDPDAVLPSDGARRSLMPTSPTVEITYCRLCGWGLRASWMAQELLATFAEEIGSVTLTPDASGGVFEVRAEGELIWSRKEQKRFPEITELKQMVRDRIAPERSLGHSDRAHGKEA